MNELSTALCFSGRAKARIHSLRPLSASDLRRYTSCDTLEQQHGDDLEYDQSVFQKIGEHSTLNLGWIKQSQMMAFSTTVLVREASELEQMVIDDIRPVRSAEESV